MAWALQFDGLNDRISAPVAGGSATIYIKLAADIPPWGGSDEFIFDGRPGTSTYYLRRSGSALRLGISNYRINGVSVTADDIFNAVAGDLISFSVSVSGAFTLFGRGTGGAHLGSLVEYVEVDYGLGVVQRNDATASDHSNTGQQPVLVDTIGSNDATGVGFPTDGSAWVDLGGGGNVDGTIAITMSSFTSAGSGSIGEAVTGTVSELMDDLVINGAGVVGGNPTGTVNITMSSISSSTTGNIGEAVAGTSLVSMSDIIITSSGNIGESVTGTSTPQADDFTIYGEGTFALAVTGTANIQMEDFTIYGRESEGDGGIYGAISVVPIEIEEINAIPIEVITK